MDGDTVGARHVFRNRFPMIPIPLSIPEAHRKTLKGLRRARREWDGDAAKRLAKACADGIRGYRQPVLLAGPGPLYTAEELHALEHPDTGPNVVPAYIRGQRWPMNLEADKL